MRRPTATTRPAAGARRYLWWVLAAETLPGRATASLTVGMPTAMRAAPLLAAAAAATSRLLTDRDALSAADGALQAICLRRSCAPPTHPSCASV